MPDRGSARSAGGGVDLEAGESSVAFASQRADEFQGVTGGEQGFAVTPPGAPEGGAGGNQLAHLATDPERRSEPSGPGRRRLAAWIEEFIAVPAGTRRDVPIVDRECPHDLLERQVGEAASFRHVFHVAPAVRRVRVEQGVAAAVKLKRPHSEAFTKPNVEGGSRFHPPAGKPELGEAVEDEQVRPEPGQQLLAGQVVAHVRETKPRRDTNGTGERGQHYGLGDAISSPLREDCARAVAARIPGDRIGVIPDPVAHHVEEPRCAFLIAGGAGGYLFRTAPDRRSAAVDEPGGAQIRLKILSGGHPASLRSFPTEPGAGRRRGQAAAATGTEDDAWHAPRKQPDLERARPDVDPAGPAEPAPAGDRREGNGAVLVVTLALFLMFGVFILAWNGGILTYQGVRKVIRLIRE